MTDTFPVDPVGEGTGALSYLPARSESDTSEYADHHNLNDIGLALRVVHSPAV